MSVIAKKEILDQAKALLFTRNLSEGSKEKIAKALSSQENVVAKTGAVSSEASKKDIRGLFETSCGSQQGGIVNVLCE